MKISKEEAKALGLVIVNGETSTAMGREDLGFDGPRIYVNNAPPFVEWSGATIHLSGYTPEEAELLGAVPNQKVISKKTGKQEYFASARIPGFLEFTKANLEAAAEVLKHHVGAGWERPGASHSNTPAEQNKVRGVFAAIAASKSE